MDQKSGPAPQSGHWYRAGAISTITCEDAIGQRTGMFHLHGALMTWKTPD